MAKFGVNFGKKSPMSHVGECGVSEKKKEAKKVGGSPTRGGSSSPTRGGVGGGTRNFRWFPWMCRLKCSTIFDQNPLVPEGTKITPPRGRPPSLRVGTPLPYAGEIPPPLRGKARLFASNGGLPQGLLLHGPPEGVCRAAQIRRCGAAVSGCAIKNRD